MNRTIRVPASFFRAPFAAMALIAGMAPGSALGDAFSETLSENLAKWQRMRPAHYQYHRWYSCFCLPVNYLVEAEGGVVTQAKPVNSGSPPSTPSLQSHSIDSAFAMLMDIKSHNPDRLEVTYDREFGFPSYIRVDYRSNIIDDEISYSISQFRVFPPGLTLANDTVFTADHANRPEERRVLRVANSGDSALYLNSVELSVAPEDTFSHQGVAVQFAVAEPASATQPLRPVLRYGFPASDTVEALGGIPIAPGKDLVLADFRIDPCFCLLKAGRQIKDGDTLTLMLRLDFSRGAPAPRGDVRAYAYVRGTYGITSGLAGAPARREAGAESITGWRGGLWLDRDRAYTPDGRLVPVLP